MTDFSLIKKEIIDYINKKYKDHGKFNSIVKKVNDEIDVLSSTEGLGDVNNLNTFYDIWKNYKKEDEDDDENVINSWTAYFLGMTSAKPSGDFLPTRRAFARAGFPDIDTDFDYEDRDDVYAYIIDKYGRDNVGNIGTHGLLKFKSCVTRVTKALDLANAYHKGKDAFVSENAALVSDILSPFPKGGLLKINGEDGKSHLIKNFSDAYEHCKDFKHYVDKYSDSNFKKHIEQTERVFVNFGAHAAGIVVSNVPLDEISPLRNAKKGTLATQYPNEDLEALGLIKFDILAIATLTVVKRTVKMIKENYNIDIDVENLPMEDDATFELYRTGNLGGVFQCENYGMQKTMREIGVSSFDHIIAAIALYRPGPMDSIPEYCARKKGEHRVDYFHNSIEPFVKPYLENTYGVLVYQESVMQICNNLAGMTISDGYVMIKAIGKKKTYLMDKFEKQFIQGCVNNKVPQDVSKQYWDKFITPFASYGFNLAHSACYGLMSYTCAYLKANYPDEFICSLLNVSISSSNGDKYDKVEDFEKEFKRKMNIKFLSRDINKCKVLYTIERRKDIKDGILKTEIRPSLLCKGLGNIAAKNIEENQPYKNMRDLVEKTDSSIVDTRSIDALIENGYFGKNKIKNKDEMLKDFIMIREDMKKTSKKRVESCDMFS